MDPPRCAYCQDIVGVYEPVRVLSSDGSNRHGSVLTLGGQFDAPGSIVMHEGCYEAFEKDREQSAGTEA